MFTKRAQRLSPIFNNNEVLAAAGLAAASRVGDSAIFFHQNDLIVLDDFQNVISKTKEMNNILIKFKAKNSIIIADKKSKDNIFKSIRNIPNVKITDVNHFSAYDLAKFKKIVFTETSIKELEKRY